MEVSASRKSPAGHEVTADLKTWLGQNAGVMIAEIQEALIAQLQIEVLKCADASDKRRKNHPAKFYILK